MTVESATYINQLDATKPGATDPKSEGDDHLRLLKSTVKATFPNVTGVVTPTHTELGYVAGVTSALQTQLNAKAPLDSPALTGTPTAPTAAAGTNTTQVATTAHVLAERSNTATLTNKTLNLANNTLVATSAQLAAAVTDETGTGALVFADSPELTGTPTAPTAAGGTNTTQVATTAFVQNTAFSAALPSQTGNAGKYVTTNGTTASWAAIVSATFNEFTASGTWTKPSGATFVMVEAWGAGGGGGSGRRGSSATHRCPGIGGGGGAYVQRLFRAADLGSTVTVTIGAGGTGGAAVTANNTDGNPGNTGGNTTFGSFLTAYGANGGSAGSSNIAAMFKTSGGGALSTSGDPIVAGGGGFGSGSAGSGQRNGQCSGWGGGQGGGGNGTDMVAGSGGCSFQGGAGGGCGGGIDQNDITYTGAAGGSTSDQTGGGGAGGTTQGANGAAGSSSRHGGGGGACGSTVAAGAGGAGASPGGGGGGGGASLNGFNSGAGGAGGAGLMRVYTW